MKDKILNIIDNMAGSLLGIGIDDDSMLEKIENNKKIDLCYILSNGGSKNNKKFKLFKKGRDKKINIKKLKKFFKKKSIDNVLCDYNVIKKFSRNFMGGSVYINKGKLYIYGNIQDLKNLKERYERYTKDVELIKNSKSFILIVNNQKTRSTAFRDSIYKMTDFFNDSLDYLTEILTN